MQKHKVLNIFLAVLSIFLIGFILVRGQKIESLSEHVDNLGQTTEKIEELTGFLIHLDSLLDQNSYEVALRYIENNSSRVPDTLGNFVDIQKRLIYQMISSSPSTQIEGSQSSESNQDNTSIPIESKQMDVDSLNFVVTKMRLQLRNLEEQLKEKSSGEYLVFKTTKGVEVHYVGHVVDGKANGKGIGLLSTGSRYEGNWKNNLRHGEGAFYWPDSQVYIGNYKNDLRSGFGIYHWPNGDKFEGEWKEDERNGPGAFYDKDGKIIAKGTWKKDELIKVRKK